MRLDKWGRSYKSEPDCDFIKVQNAVLTPEAARYFRKKVFEDKYPYIYIKPNSAEEYPWRDQKYRSQFIDAARASIHSFEFDEAIRSGDQVKIEKAFDLYLAGAEFSSSECDRFMLDAHYYVATNPEVAAKLIDRALDSTKTHNDSKFASKVEKLNELKKVLAEGE